VHVNGQPGGLAVAADGDLISVLQLDIADGQIQAVRSVMSRGKLRHLGRLADLPALREQLLGHRTDARRGDA
jgi:RNA polymerase sigma-70 factor (ECF subfamily)